MLQKKIQPCMQISNFVKKNSLMIMKVSILTVITFVCLLSIMLVYEYQFFKHETQKMLSTQEEYRNYVIAVKKILHDYTKTKTRLEELETLVVEKKNDFEDVGVSGPAGFPEGVRVYSSDDSADESTGFIPINRELEYLKQSTLDYLAEQKLENLERLINPEVWFDYTDHLLARHKVQSQKKHAKRRTKVSKQKHHRVYAPAKPTSVSKSKPRVSDIGMIWPIERSMFWLSSPFGHRKKPGGGAGFHTGIDLAASKGTPVKAAASGVVVQANYSSSGYGNTIVIAHTGKYRTRYAHLHAMFVEVGQKVEQGQLIGKVGSTGCVRSKRRGGDASHLHFEVYAFGKQVNPIYFLV